MIGHTPTERPLRAHESRTSRSMLVLLAAVVFVAGVAIGVIGDRLLARKPVITTRIVNDIGRVYDQLRLTAEQRVKADSIMTRRAPRSEELMVELAERLRSVSDSVDSELRAILTPEQRGRLDSLRANQPPLMLKRKTVTPGGSTVDTFFARPPR
jgi:Spy/CpxP family protein refolding chaperone